MPTVKNILIFLAIGTAFVLIYIFFIKPAPDKPAIVSSPAAGTTTEGATSGSAGASASSINSAAAQELLNLLLSIKEIKLNDDIFASKGFASLVDTPVDLAPDGNEGRVNPFAPIGLDAVPDNTALLTCNLPQVLDNTTNTCINPPAN